MSYRSDSTQLYPGSFLSSAYAGHGVQAKDIPADGENGAGFLHPDIAEQNAQPTDEMRGQILTLPQFGTLTNNEDSSFTYTRTGDGVDSFTYRGFLGGVAYGDYIVTLAVGAAPRAILMQSGSLIQIPTADLGTGKKPLVLLDGQIKERTATEGTPIIYDPALSSVRTLAATETLLI